MPSSTHGHRVNSGSEGGKILDFTGRSKGELGSYRGKISGVSLQHFFFFSNSRPTLPRCQGSIQVSVCLPPAMVR